MAQFLFADRVKDTSSAQSSTTITLANSPPAGFQSFGAGIGDGNSCVYVLNDGTNWEITYGAYTNASKTLARAATPLASSNAGAQVAAFSGTVLVWCGAPSALLNGLVLPLAPGRLYSNAGATATTTGALVAGTVYYAPVVIGQPFSAAALGFDLSALFSGTSTVSIGLYSCAGGQPNARLVQQTGINTGTGGSSGGNATSSLALPSPQMPGLYAVGILPLTNSPTFEWVTASQLLSGLIVGRSSAGDTNAYSGWTDGTTGQSSLPATASPTPRTAGMPMVTVQASL